MDDPKRNSISNVYAMLGVPDILSEKGFGPEAIDALKDFDVSNFQWRRMLEKGEFWAKVNENIPDRVEHASLQGLVAVSKMAQDGAQAPTIGLVAEAMVIDPSRASRIVSDLVSRDFLRREVAQDDARKSILVVTDKGHAHLRDFSRRKWMLLADVFDGWTDAEIVQFSALFTRYVDRLGQVLGSGD